MKIDNRVLADHILRTIRLLMESGRYDPMTSMDGPMTAIEQAVAVEYHSACALAKRKDYVELTLYGFPIEAVVPVLVGMYVRCVPAWVKEKVAVYMACMPLTVDETIERFPSPGALHEYCEDIPTTWDDFIDRIYELEDAEK